MPAHNIEKRLLQEKDDGLIDRLDKEALSFWKWQKVITTILGILGIFITLLGYLEGKVGFYNSLAIITGLLFILYVPYIIRWSIFLSVNKLIAISTLEAERYLAFTKTEQTGVHRLEELLEAHDKTLVLRVEEAIKKLIKQEEEDKLKSLREKYHRVHFKALSSTNEFNKSETSAVKLGLVKGVQHSIRTISRIGPAETDHLPMANQEGKNYFEESKEALQRIRNNHPLSTEAKEYTVHRVFIIFKERLNKPDELSKVKACIQEYCDTGFDVRIALQEELKEHQGYTFAIYDDEIVLRLSYDRHSQEPGEGIVYFSDAVVNDVYKQRYKEIEAQSYRPDDFWKKHCPAA
jgi:hypothetical protein